MSDQSGIVWDLETVTDLLAAARMLHLGNAAQADVRQAAGTGLPQNMFGVKPKFAISLRAADNPIPISRRGWSDKGGPRNDRCVIPSNLWVIGCFQRCGLQHQRPNGCTLAAAVR
jgi:hypothetical protein